MRKPETEAEKLSKKKAATAKAMVNKKAEAEAKKKAKAETETVQLRLHTEFDHIAVQTRSFPTDNRLHCISLTGKTGRKRQKKQSQTGPASRRNSRRGRDLTAEL